MKPAYILFFVDGPAPTAEDFAQAAAMPAKVVFRNARAVPLEPHSMEICDGVAGCVPDLYAQKFPDAEEAIYTHAAKLQALAASVGDSPAPKRAPAKKTAVAAPAKTDTPAAATPPAPGGTPAWNPNPQ
jgi:hypothetical protein